MSVDPWLQSVGPSLGIRLLKKQYSQEKLQKSLAALVLKIDEKNRQFSRKAQSIVSQPTPRGFFARWLHRFKTAVAFQWLGKVTALCECKEHLNFFQRESTFFERKAALKWFHGNKHRLRGIRKKLMRVVVQIHKTHAVEQLALANDIFNPEDQNLEGTPEARSRAFRWVSGFCEQRLFGAEDSKKIARFRKSVHEQFLTRTELSRLLLEKITEAKDALRARIGKTPRNISELSFKRWLRLRLTREQQRRSGFYQPIGFFEWFFAIQKRFLFKRVGVLEGAYRAVKFLQPAGSRTQMQRMDAFRVINAASAFLKDGTFFVSLFRQKIAQVPLPNPVSHRPYGGISEGVRKVPLYTKDRPIKRVYVNADEVAQQASTDTPTHSGDDAVASRSDDEAGHRTTSPVRSNSQTLFALKDTSSSGELSEEETYTNKEGIRMKAC